MLRIDCAGVILSGGENIRMGKPKAFIKVNGESIIERSLKTIRKLFKEIFIVTNEPEAYFYLGETMLGDVYNVRGPMTGILTSLINSTYPWVFVVGCDMPFINHELIRFMALKRTNHDAVAPRLRDSIEPLFAFYSKGLAPAMEKAVLEGKTGLRFFLKDKKVKYVREEEIRNIDPQGKSFINLNTPEDAKLYLRNPVLLKER